MTNEQLSEPVNILLSREELLLVLDLLQAESIPGLDADPLGDLNEDGRALSSIVAGRGLRARELAMVNEDGELAVHNSLLTAVGVCAYSTNTVFVYHWPGPQETPVRYFGHVRDDEVVAHTRPEDVLHLFTLLPTKKHLTDQVLEACGYEEQAERSAAEMTISDEAFVQVRELAGDGDVTAASAVLTSNGVAADAAEALAKTFASSPRVSILQALTQEGDDTVHKSDFTLVQSDEHTWFIAPAADESENPPLLIKSATKAEIETLLGDLL